jgi:hypothetical protein
MSNNTVFPLFAFERDHALELETGLTLAGILIVDTPKGKGPKKKDTDRIIWALTDMVNAGTMPLDARIYCWPEPPGDVPPANAVDTDDHEAMWAWADRSFVIAVRGADDTKQMDSIMRRESGSGFLDS